MLPLIAAEEEPVQIVVPVAVHRLALCPLEKDMGIRCCVGCCDLRCTYNSTTPSKVSAVHVSGEREGRPKRVCRVFRRLVVFLFDKVLKRFGSVGENQHFFHMGVTPPPTPGLTQQQRNAVSVAQCAKHREDGRQDHAAAAWARESKEAKRGEAGIQHAGVVWDSLSLRLPMPLLVYSSSLFLCT